MAFGAPAPRWISLKSGQPGGERNRGERRAEKWDETANDKDR